MMIELQVRIHPDFSLLQDLSEQLGISPERNSLSFPDSLGRGSLRTYYSGDWLTLNVFRMQPATSFTFTTVNFPDSGLVSFIVNFNSPNLSKIISGKEVSIANTVPKGVLYQGQGTPAQMQFGRGENYYFFNFNIRLNALLQKASGTDTDWLKENGVFLFQEFNPVLDPEIQQFEAADDSLGGTLAREASALRIASHLLKEFSARFLRTPTVRQSEEEIQALFRVRHQLSTDFLVPIPTIADLARRAHMSESKFKRAFKALFGRPVYEYARYLRLLEARRLLADGHHNISEVAFAIGYTNTSWEKVDVLFNNAGVLLADMQRSRQGNELHYEVNTLSPFLLTTRLKPALDRSAHPVVVNTVADFAAQEKGINYEELLRPKKIKKLFGSYMQSKLAITALMKWLAEQPDWQNVRIVSVTPGANKTKMTASRGMPAWLVPLRNLFFAKPTKGANLLYQGAFGLPARQSGTFLKGNKVHPLKFTPSRSDINQLLSGLQRSYLRA